MKAIRKNLKMLPDHNDMLHKEHEGWLDEWDQNMVHGDVIAFVNILILCLDHCTWLSPWRKEMQHWDVSGKRSWDCNATNRRDGCQVERGEGGSTEAMAGRNGTHDMWAGEQGMKQSHTRQTDDWMTRYNGGRGLEHWAYPTRSYRQKEAPHGDHFSTLKGAWLSYMGSRQG